MYINSKTPKELLEDPILREFYVRRHETFENQRKEGREKFYRELKKSALAFGRKALKFTGILTGVLALGVITVATIPNKKDLAQIVHVNDAVNAIVRQAEYSINRGDMEKAKALYQEAMNLVPDNNLGRKYKKNLEDSISAIR